MDEEISEILYLWRHLLVDLGDAKLLDYDHSSTYVYYRILIHANRASLIKIISWATGMAIELYVIQT